MATELETEIPKDSPEKAASGDATQKLAAEALARPESKPESKPEAATEGDKTKAAAPEHLEITPITQVLAKPEEKGDAPTNGQADKKEEKGWLDVIHDRLFGEDEEPAPETAAASKPEAAEKPEADQPAEDERGYFARAYDYLFSTEDEKSLVDDVHDAFTGDDDEKSMFTSAWDSVCSASDYVFSVEDETSMWDDVSDWLVGDDDETSAWEDFTTWTAETWDWASEEIFSLEEDSFFDDCSDWLFGDEDEESIFEQADDWLFGEDGGFFGDDDDWFSWGEDAQELADISIAVGEAESAYGRAMSLGDVDQSEVGALQGVLSDVQSLAARVDDPVVQGKCAAVMAALSAKISEAQNEVARDAAEGNYGDGQAQTAISLSQSDLGSRGSLTDGDRQMLEGSYQRLADTYFRKGDPEYLNVLGVLSSLIDSDKGKVGDESLQAA